MVHHFGPNGPYPGWLHWGGLSTTEQYKAHPSLLAEHLPWLEKRPLMWQNEHVLVSHAGLNASPHALNPEHHDGLLWARGPLKRLNQLQVVGHTPMARNEPKFDRESNALYIDTGAVFGGNLTAARLSPTGKVLDMVLVPVSPEDLLEKPRLSYLTPS
jgi:serine/threonine protein phosphatase 1